MTLQRTTFEDAATFFAGRSVRATAALAAWRADSRRVRVVPIVERMATSVAYGVTTGDIESVAGRSEHALGTVSRRNAETVRSIRDWDPAFAIEHVLHAALERVGHVPTYQEFRQFCETDEHAREALWGPAQMKIVEARRGPQGRYAADAMRWRIGNSYYAFLKELYVLAALRESGIRASYHVLPDVLFRVDLWVDDLCVLLYVGNRLYRDRGEGRKVDPRVLLADAGLRFVDLRLPTPNRYGRVNLPEASQAVAAVRRAMDLQDTLRAAGPDVGRGD